MSKVETKKIALISSKPWSTGKMHELILLDLETLELITFNVSVELPVELDLPLANLQSWYKFEIELNGMAKPKLVGWKAGGKLEINAK